MDNYILPRGFEVILTCTKSHVRNTDTNCEGVANDDSLEVIAGTTVRGPASHRFVRSLAFKVATRNLRVGGLNEVIEAGNRQSVAIIGTNSGRVDQPTRFRIWR